MTVQDKKKGTLQNVTDTVTLQLPLRSFTKPGTCALSENQYAVTWDHLTENEQNEDEHQSIQSDIVFEFGFKDPLIVPFHKVWFLTFGGVEPLRSLQTTSLQTSSLKHVHYNMLYCRKSTNYFNH